MKAILHFKSTGMRDGELHSITNKSPYDLERDAYMWFDSEPRYFMVLSDGTEEEYDGIK